MVMALTAFHMAALLIAAIILILSAISDLRRFQIPNIMSLLLVLLFPLFVLTAPHSVEWEQNLIVSGLVLVSGFAMFLGNLAGAGDIKLLAATSLWAGPHFIAVLIVSTAISGGLLALAIAGLTYMRNQNKEHPLPLAKVPIPYGIAIAVGGLNMLFMISRPIFFPG